MYVHECVYLQRSNEGVISLEAGIIGSRAAEFDLDHLKKRPSTLNY